MFPMHLSKQCKIERVGAPLTDASNHDDNSSRLDMQGYDGVVFITSILDCVSGGVATLNVEQNDDDSDTGMAAITGASATKTSAGNDDLNGQYLVVDVYRPRKRYLQGVRISATQNIEYSDIWAIRYSGPVAPITLTGHHVAIQPTA